MASPSKMLSILSFESDLHDAKEISMPMVSFLNLIVCRLVHLSNVPEIQFAALIFNEAFISLSEIQPKNVSDQSCILSQFPNVTFSREVSL